MWVIKILVLSFTLLSIFSCSKIEQQNVKNILVYLFAGGKSHTFILMELIKNTSDRNKIENPNTKYVFHVLVHEVDKDLWKKIEDYQEYFKLYVFGDVNIFMEKFLAAFAFEKDNKLFGHNKLYEHEISLYEEFFNSNLLEKIKETKYDLIITDFVNFLPPFLRRELKIEKMMYLNPTCKINYWYLANMEYNAAYEPFEATHFKDEMSFFERLQNFFIKIANEIILYRSIQIHNKPFIERGYEPVNPYQPHSIYLNQCVDGVHFPMSLPPNFIFTGAFLPKPPNPLPDGELNTFLSKYKKIIYVGQGTMAKSIVFEEIVDIFNHFPDYGFIFSIRNDTALTIPLPKNVLGLHWTSQNDLLGDKRLHGFITHGGLNSILESIYHAKPMIVLGTFIDQVNGAVLVKTRKYGIGFTSENSITKEGIIEAIHELMTNPIYSQEILKGSEIVREKNGRDSFYYWLHYVLDYGYEHLIIPGFENYSHFQMYNFDVLCVVFIMVIIFVCLFFWIIYKMIGLCVNKKN